MCRPKSAGGRRCPAHSTPEYRAKENARRRAQYAAKKQTNVPSGWDSFGIRTTATGETPEPLNTGTIITGKPTTEWLEHIQQTLPDSDPFGFDKVRDINLTRTEPRPKVYENSGMEYLQEHNIQKDPRWTEEDQIALDLYTGDYYATIHEYIYRGQYLPDHYDPKPGGDIKHAADNLYEYFNTTASNYQTIIKQLDDVCEKYTNNKQKIVYRGLSQHNQLVTYDSHNNIVFGPEGRKHKNPLLEHVQKDVQIGQEIVFDSYLSTSLNLNEAIQFSPMRVVCEILTPKGAFVAAATENPTEMEVMMPRGQRYKIVGMKTATPDSKIAGCQDLVLIQMVAINSKGEILDGTNDDPLPPVPTRETFPGEEQ